MWVLGYHLSVAVAIGFIALAGVAAETGVVMLIYLDHAYRERRERGALRTRGDVDAAVEYGAVERVRPKMMTVTAIMAGLVPILWSQGTGADVMKRVAAPMVGGMVTSTVLTLVVIPVIYSLWKEREIATHGATYAAERPRESAVLASGTSPYTEAGSAIAAGRGTPSAS
ncbi:MAG TPA: efflux RND transporter permease subunit, partial [Candidatus Elarobacter sp.]|nr:efflux RND transporter permease subunit [Candidatus Elarobacter sp.]